MQFYSTISDAFPSLPEFLPTARKSAGLWHTEDGESDEPSVRSKDLTWTGLADNLVAGGAMPCSVFHAPGGGFRPGNNTPPMASRMKKVDVDGHTHYYIPDSAYETPTAAPAPDI